MKATILYAKFSPFHEARLQRTAVLGRDAGHSLSSIEISSSQHDYEWPEEKSPRAFQSLTLFPKLDYWAIPQKQLRGSLYQALDVLNPDVLVVPGWGFREARIGLGWSVRKRIPRVVISDSQPEDGSRNPAKAWMRKLLAQRFHTAFVGGAPHLRYMAKLGIPAERCFVGCDVVENEFFQSPATAKVATSGPKAPRPALLSTLRLLPRKNILTILKVLAGSNPQWDWLIAGDGPDRPRIEASISSLGLQARVRLLGHVEYSRLPETYRQADVYLQPSLAEPWGLAVNEAMASGLPVLVSDRCGCREDLVQPGTNGFLFDPEQPESFANVLNKMWETRDRWRAMGQASKDIISRWGLDLYAENFWKACERAVREPRASLSTRMADSLVKLAL